MSLISNHPSSSPRRSAQREPAVHFAILGAGAAADFHRQALAACADSEAQLAAVAHYAPERFDDLQARFGVPCLTYEEVLARPDIDAVCLCTPSGQHAEQALAAAKAGKHVLVEKPMALHPGDADRMIAACKAAGVRLGVVFQRRALPLFRQVRRAVEAGDFGALTLGVVTVPYFRSPSYYGQAAWRGTWALDGGGVLMNQGIHLLDLLLWYMGDPTEVQARAGTLHHAVEVEDVLTATLVFEGGAQAALAAATTARPGFPHRLELYGTGGGVQLEGETVRRWMLADAAKAHVAPPETSARADAGAGGDPRGITLAGHVGVLRDFANAVREDRAPLVPGAEGRRSVQVVQDIYRAAGLPAPA